MSINVHTDRKHDAFANEDGMVKIGLPVDSDRYGHEWVWARVKAPGVAVIKNVPTLTAVASFGDTVTYTSPQGGLYGGYCKKFGRVVCAATEPFGVATCGDDVDLDTDEGQQVAKSRVRELTASARRLGWHVSWLGGGIVFVAVPLSAYESDFDELIESLSYVPVHLYRPRLEEPGAKCLSDDPLDIERLLSLSDETATNDEK